VQIARPAFTGADGELAREMGFGSRRECRAFLAAHVNPLYFFQTPERIGKRVAPIPLICRKFPRSSQSGLDKRPQTSTIRTSPSAAPAKRIASSASARPPAYLRVLHGDLLLFRDEFFRTAIGLIIGAVGGLLFVSFVLAALLVSAWDTKLRSAAAWGVSALWLAIALTGLAFARRALRAPPPFANLMKLLQQDISAIDKVEA